MFFRYQEKFSMESHTSRTSPELEHIFCVEPTTIIVDPCILSINIKKQQQQHSTQRSTSFVHSRNLKSTTFLLIWGWNYHIKCLCRHPFRCQMQSRWREEILKNSRTWFAANTRRICEKMKKFSDLPCSREKSEICQIERPQVTNTQETRKERR